ncbi:hypothetical protein DICPUDRAFT_82049 [Dictyostelium purpureum]|uniref:FZ domain-containing protein n=1 Tax=Dictyostelium purpureum TaxID=5786 RepID=F0ZVD2_DICPU|nr:uncharacterized protein DICPUDRAFT_82049 [Dictyostelium purpureum]EGC32086.1 hypothetical protein DICPUDRAFT_82049 [Dictyostelium purpureum]|eukprot:XP_003291375.1 hypothetical protein DICPUDRAFT_82049 [Dictyostelium purpureum]
MKKILFLIFIFLLFITLFINKSVSQNNEIELGGTCQPFNETSVCYPYLNYTSFYLPPNTTFQSTNNNASYNLGLLQLTTKECKSNATYLFCLQSFPKCNIEEEKLPNSTTITFYLPSLPCHDVCYPGQYNFSIPIQCTNTNLLIKHNNSNEIECPSPLLNAKDYVKEGKDLYYYVTDSCIIDCPFDIYPKDKMKILDRANWALTVLSFVACTYMIITFGVLPNKITHNMESILSLTIGAWITCLSLFVESADNNFSCSLHDRGRFKSQSDHLCLLVGILFQFGAITSIFWCPVITYEVYINSKMKPLKHFGRYRIFIWSLIVILTALPAFGGKYGATVATSGCWISSDDGGVWQYLCFYIPSWISLSLMTIFAILSVIKITKMYLKSPNRLILFFNAKMILTIVFLLFNITFASSLKFYLEERIDEFFDSVYLWAHCISTTVGDKSSFVVSILGLTVFLGFGIDPLVISIWTESTKLRWIINKIGLNKYINLSTSSSSSSSTNSNNSNNTNEKKRNSFKNIKLKKTPNENNDEGDSNNISGDIEKI